MSSAAAASGTRRKFPTMGVATLPRIQALGLQWEPCRRPRLGLVISCLESRDVANVYSYQQRGPSHTERAQEREVAAFVSTSDSVDLPSMTAL